MRGNIEELRQDLRNDHWRPLLQLEGRVAGEIGEDI